MEMKNDCRNALGKNIYSVAHLQIKETSVGCLFYFSIKFNQKKVLTKEVLCVNILHVEENLTDMGEWWNW